MPAASEPANLRVATFQCDVTPPIGHWLYAHPLKTVEHPLLAKGVMLEQDGKRYVLCAIDWCVLSSEPILVAGAMAGAAGTDLDNTAIQCVHVHTAVIIDSNAKQLLTDVEDPPAYYDPAFLEKVAADLAGGVHDAMAAWSRATASAPPKPKSTEWPPIAGLWSTGRSAGEAVPAARIRPWPSCPRARSTLS